MLKVQFWHQLESAENLDEIDRLLQSLWQTQETQELAVDAHADLADQIDAEIAGITARMQYLIELHSKAINKLQGWRERLDKTVIYFNNCDVLTSEIIGKHRRIAVKENPPTCEVSIDPSQLPAPYRRVETKTVISADKKAIVNAWKQGIPVDGTRVFRKRKVVYSLLPGNNLHTLPTNQTFESRSSDKTQPKKRR
ncbi:MAG: siphovirus Gp157 family protein [Microcoleus sp. PH2017_10_PVI_O_A]|uniref:siphovirus Gp157 family protein n=1 Tax=unclassified Microcoleus TaxID=2642155 RepID=UPI001D43BBD9|nr:MULTISPECIES: siphovirus Gp157 family protein [unclassified Microcoleus]MCC3407958.1 siphovirus Gp157 family protein [Microcoleus sp. PH2017_10_PVI_O_A]MCC3462129.1 siphovirus Gp157 family protein [Microcoleus sp. PH2017_11_PCY_U_A]MCC3480562.1 siphovirus Gp157 family protein [Microcoleus sp. PH2017_12_PCY_D_A]MCC3529957.1 siphovirus Gp157 family protein [Microcoleus sp. PH2017_21_RUC_O_A]MCC3542251.1 siphovirus Gp157 family protein [Microcoleus sp. PH2017_22_RUC_O_B]